MKKLICVLVLAAFAVSLSACSGKPDESPAAGNAADSAPAYTDTADASYSDPAAEETQAAAAEPGAIIHSGDLSFRILEDGTASLYLIHNSKSIKDIVIPSEIEGVAVTSIENFTFSSCDALVSVTIPDSVTTIGEYAFESGGSVTLIVGRDSYAAAYAEALGLKYSFAE